MLSRTSCSGMPEQLRHLGTRSFSMSSPFLPITMPGRAVWIAMFASSADALDLDAAAPRHPVSFLLQKLAHAVVLLDIAGEGLRVANHFEDHSRRDPEPNADRIDFLTQCDYPVAHANA